MDLLIKYNTVEDLTKEPRDKFCVEFTPAIIKTHQSNPALATQDAVAQIVGVADDHVVGGLFPFPVKVFADGREYKGTSAHSYWVDEAYRKTGLGIDLLDLLIDVAPDKIAITCGISKQARPIYQMMGFSIFHFSQVVLIFKSCYFLKRKLSGIGLKCVCRVVDLALLCHTCLIKCLDYVLNFSMKVEQVKADDKEKIKKIYCILQQDKHRFREEHDENWFRWLLENKFSDDKRSKQSLYLVSIRHSPIAFFMTKVRPVSLENNRLVGSLLEWGCCSYRQMLVPRLLLRAVMSFGNTVDCVYVETDDRKCVSFLRCLGLLPCTDGVMAMKVFPGSPLQEHEGYNKQENWRMRPGNGDHGLS